jgi:hypothetical protein
MRLSHLRVLALLMLRILDSGHYNSQLASLHLQSYHATAAYLFAGSYASSAADMLSSIATSSDLISNTSLLHPLNLYTVTLTAFHRSEAVVVICSLHLAAASACQLSLILHSHLAGARFLPEAVSTSRHAISLNSKSILIALLFCTALGSQQWSFSSFIVLPPLVVCF